MIEENSVPADMEVGPSSTEPDPVVTGADPVEHASDTVVLPASVSGGDDGDSDERGAVAAAHSIGGTWSFVHGRLFDSIVAVGVVVVSAIPVVLLWPALSIPFFTDEAWRAYYIGLPSGQFLGQLNTIQAPMSAGWMYAARLRADLFGDTEFVLRAPSLLLVPVLGLVVYLLARRMAGPITAAAAAVATTTSTAVLMYATMFKPYISECVSVVLMLLLWLVVIGSGRRRWVRLVLALVIGLIPVYALPGIFVAGPLAAVYGLRAIVIAVHRGRAKEYDGARFVTTVGIVVLMVLPGIVHAGTFLLAQTRKLNSVNIGDYWFWGYWPIDKHPSEQVAWFRKMLGTWVPGMLTDGFPQPHDKVMPWVTVGGVRADLITAGLLACWVFAIVAARRSAAVRWLWVAVIGSALCTLVLSAARAWPFGWARVNLFLLPLLLLLAAAGFAEALRLAALILRSHSRGERLRVVGRTVVGAVSCAVVIVGVAAIVATASIVPTSLRMVHGSISTVNAAQRMRDLSLLMRQQCGPDSVVVGERVFTREMRYYLLYYDGYSPAIEALPKVPEDRILIVPNFGDAAVEPWLETMGRPNRLCLYMSFGYTGPTYHEQIARLATLGYVVTDTKNFGGTGSLTILDRAAVG